MVSAVSGKWYYICFIRFFLSWFFLFFSQIFLAFFIFFLFLYRFSFSSVLVLMLLSAHFKRLSCPPISRILNQRVKKGIFPLGGWHKLKKKMSSSFSCSRAMLQKERDKQPCCAWNSREGNEIMIARIGLRCILQLICNAPNVTTTFITAKASPPEISKYSTVTYIFLSTLTMTRSPSQGMSWLLPNPQSSYPRVTRSQS